MKLTLNKLVALGITVLIGIIMIVALVFPLLSMHTPTSTVSESGFSFLSFTSEIISKKYGWSEIILGVLCVFTLIAGVSVIILAVLILIIEGYNKKLLFISNTVCLALSFLYMLAGTIAVIISNANFNNLFSTLAYIPFILTCLFYIAFVFCLKKLPDKEFCKRNSKQNYKKELKRVIELKQLLDMGAITKEEFDKKKKELLNL